MVERIHKVETDSLRVERKEEASDEHEDKSQKGQSEKEEQDEFAPKLSFEKWTGKKVSKSQSPQLLWNQRAASQTAISEADAQDEISEPAQKEKTIEEATTSTTITFLRAAGILSLGGQPRWGTISLYILAFLGFLVALTIVINALL